MMDKNVLGERKNLFKRFLNQSKNQIKKILPIDTAMFLLQFLRHPQDIGALTPSSAHLAEAMTRYVQNDNPGSTKKKYLEAGGGTGAFTKAIIDKLGPSDILDVIEINPIFCERLCKKYSQYPNVHIHAGSVLDWRPHYKYDAIVSSLPFNAFRASFVEQIYDHYGKIAVPGGILSYCEYLALPGIKKIFLTPSARRALKETLETTCAFENTYEIHLDKVFANFPPACVHHCRFPG